MRKTLQFILLFVFCLPMLIAYSQSKYAIVIGINSYYNAPGQLSPFCLKGCVNDANSIKSLLVNRFGFDKKNVISLLDENATQTNLLATFQAILDKCQQGDAVLFYYCGHGIWMYNDGNKNDSVKQGFNQAICLSNLYAPNFECLVKDNTLKKIFNQFVDKKVVVTSIFDCCFSGNLAMDQIMYAHNNYYYPQLSSFEPKSLFFENIESSSRSFNPKITLTITDAEKVARPSERKDSRFLSISACGDNQIAMEIYDEANLPHGAFTKALLSVYNTHSASLPLSQVFNEIKNELKTKQLFLQQPAIRLDSSRFNSNLIGISNKTFSDAVSVQCNAKTGDTVVINAGFNAGMMKGNILTANGKKIKIVRVQKDSSIAVAITGASIIKQNDTFILADSYITSEPLLKIYIPQSNYSSKEFTDFFNNKILPLTKEKGYRDYNNWDVESLSYNYGYRNALSNATLEEIAKQQNKFYIFLPVPSDVAAAIKKELQKNQNLQLVTTDKKADLVLYLNYAKATDKTKAGFVFTYRNPISADVNVYESRMFYIYNTQVPRLLFTKNSLLNLTQQITNMTLPLLRATGTHWLNDYARR